jgi:hypothetical protein
MEATWASAWSFSSSAVRAVLRALSIPSRDLISSAGSEPVRKGVDQAVELLPRGLQLLLDLSPPARVALAVRREPGEYLVHGALEDPRIERFGDCG